MRVLRALWHWFDDRTGLSALFVPLAKHPVPPGSTWLYVFGSATLVAFIIQVVTGVALATVYVPSAGQAYNSLHFITNDAPLGSLLRGMHYFGASAMILLIGVHALRVFLMGSYKFPREVNWLTGVALLGLTVLMGFTGQLLRWDQNAVWSIVVGAEQAGRTPIIGRWLAHFIMAGDVVGGATLSRFFSIHVFLVPALIFGVVGFHLYLVLHHGISEPPESGRPVDPRTYRSWYRQMLEREGRPFFPDAVWRDALFAVVVISAVIALALVVGPPLLGKPPDPTIVQANPRPDWYLLWYFAVLALLPHGSENYVMILGPLTAGLVLILLPLVFPRGERSPRRRPWAVAIVVMIVLSVGTLWRAGVKADWSPDFSAVALPAGVIGAGSGPVLDGGRLFVTKACIYCHAVSGYGGHRGPDLTNVGKRLNADEMTVRILDGGYNMPAFGGILKPAQVKALVAFLQSRRTD
jgi:ubiquinol-cytochrome c reductase cytochrome b subunit